MKNLVLQGVIPACIMPFKSDYEIDELSLRKFINYLLGIKDITGILCNGHAGEVASLSRSERREVIKIFVNEVKGRVPVISGIYHESTSGATQHAQDAENEGADAVLIIPPGSWLRGKNEEAPYHLFQSINDAVNIPICIFQYAAISKANYPTAKLLQLTGIENVVAVKESVNDWIRYDQEYRALKSLPKKIQVLTSNNMSLLASFTLGSDGAIIGSGSLCSELITQIFSEIKDNNLNTARQIHNRMMPLMEVIYNDPLCDVYTRIKTAQVMLGRLENAVVRPPLLPLAEQEIEKIKRALLNSKLL